MSSPPAADPRGVCGGNGAERAASREGFAPLWIWIPGLGALALWLHFGGFGRDPRALHWFTQDLPAMLGPAMQRWAWPRLVSWLTVLGDTHMLLLLWLAWALGPFDGGPGVGKAHGTTLASAWRAHFAARRVTYAAMGLTLLLGAAASITMEDWFHAIRPAGLLPRGDAWDAWLTVIGPRLSRHAFPLGHSMAAFAGVGLLLPTLASPWARHLALAMAGLVALSRVAAGVHWPIDVTVGALLGLVCCAAGWWCAEALSGRPDRAALAITALAWAALGTMMLNLLLLPFWDLGYPQAAGAPWLALGLCAWQAARALGGRHRAAGAAAVGISDRHP